MKTEADVVIRRSGNAGIISIPKQAMKALRLSVGSVLGVSIKQGSVVLTPKKKEQTLEEMLSGCTPADFAMDADDREWHDSKPAGREVI